MLEKIVDSDGKNVRTLEVKTNKTLFEQIRETNKNPSDFSIYVAWSTLGLQAFGVLTYLVTNSDQNNVSMSEILSFVAVFNPLTVVIEGNIITYAVSGCEVLYDKYKSHKKQIRDVNYKMLD